ncbi:hypothetical protein N9Z27_01675 [Alphaproteobacteria bacterium]|nr:hypothetical protein [Alphaproteobacteria bacterium]
MSLSFLSPARTVLLVADEALFIYTMSGAGVRLISSVPWTTQDFDKDVARIIVKDCKKRPVLILNDMVEQHYRKERVIKKGVGILDRSSMLERKLRFAFPNYPIRASFLLKEKIKKSESVAAADVYIFAAVPNSDQFKRTLDATRKSFAPIAGVCLLPVESADMVKILSDKSEAGKPKKSKWSIFISQHRSGGLRQIVTKDGEIALTRMTPLSSSQAEPEAWASEVQSEFSATMSYVSRFGFQPENGLHVVIVADALAGRAFEGLVEENYDCTAFTPEDAAKKLGLSIGRQDPEGYGNVLHVAWAGRKTKFALPLKAAAINKVSQPRKIATAASFLLFCSACFFTYQVFSSLVSLATLGGDISDKKQQYSRLQTEHDREVERKNALGIDIKLVQSSIGVYERLESKRIDSLFLFKEIGRALGRDMRIDNIELQTLSESDSIALPSFNTFAPDAGEEKNFIYQAKMQMTYPSTADIDEGNAEVRDLKLRLEKLLPNHQVELTKTLGDYEYANEVELRTGNNKPDDVTQDFIVELVLKGREKE